MSMLSAKRDYLHDMADRLDMVAEDFLNANHAFTVDGMLSILYVAAKMLRDAADTIWSLRNKLGDMTDERDDLREENAKLMEKSKRLFGRSVSKGIVVGMQKERLVCLRSENDDLRIENANLKSLLKEALEKQFSDEDKLQAENAKLRELVRDMWFWSYCGHMDTESQEWQMKHIDGVLERMQELGIEVSDA